jgi:hypothetical protein
MKIDVSAKNRALLPSRKILRCPEPQRRVAGVRILTKVEMKSKKTELILVDTTDESMYQRGSYRLSALEKNSFPSLLISQEIRENTDSNPK